MPPAQFLLLPVFWGMLHSISILATVPGKALWDEKISGAARGMAREATCEKAAVLAPVRKGGGSWLVGILVSHPIYKLPYRFLPFHASHSPGQVPVFQLLLVQRVMASWLVLVKGRF